MIKDDNTVIHFNNPKVQASAAANTFAISGHAETKQMNDIPNILSHLVSILFRFLAHFIHCYKTRTESLKGEGREGEGEGSVTLLHTVLYYPEWWPSTYQYLVDFYADSMYSPSGFPANLKIQEKP